MFCATILSGHVLPGVWFPEEAIDGGDDMAAMLDLASWGAHMVKVEGTLDLLTCEIWGK